MPVEGRAPLRSIDDFIGAESRFEIPNIANLDRWSNRVLNNLLYYQTNYFIVFALVFILVGMVNPTQILVGMAATVSTLELLNYLSRHQAAFAGLRRRHPGICMTIMLVGGYLIMSMIGSVMIFLFGIALPILLIFIHASLRLRNLKSKIWNRGESLGLISTPMGIILDHFGETFETLSN
ncbi:PRA1 family protein 3 [Galendromus occidentalis]|uniref:PRA1 family protein n=1 Tax=Galendromus occidentalis TaxID=34638 RepID=A0AAJ6QPU4_9ACAR|nr:PRA1 family protein 3 [Galendromus occidentalis]